VFKIDSVRTLISLVSVFAFSVRNWGQISRDMRLDTTRKKEIELLDGDKKKPRYPFPLAFLLLSP
jgi:hypothetical protein